MKTKFKFKKEKVLAFINEWGIIRFLTPSDNFSSRGQFISCMVDIPLVMYFADKKHLSRYGRPIFGQSYFKTGEFVYCPETYKTLLSESILSRLRYNSDYLSESDKICITNSYVEIIANDIISLQKLVSKEKYQLLYKDDEEIDYLDMLDENISKDMIEYIKLQSENEYFLDP